MAFSDDLFADDASSQAPSPPDGSSADSPSGFLRAIRAFRALCWGITILAAVGAAAFVTTHVGVARSGDQQVAVVGIGLLLVAVPYVIARGVSELTP
jgi:hypothetical protein